MTQDQAQRKIEIMMDEMGPIEVLKRLERNSPSDAADCCALVDALSDVLPQHTMACVSGLNTYCQPWSFAVTDDGSPLVTLESCQCSGGSMKYLRGLLPEGHSKGFSYNDNNPANGSK